jgi:hypothetical protein
VILRILVQESHDSQLRLKRYEGKKFRGQNWKFGKFRGIFVNVECWEGHCGRLRNVA